MRTKTTTYYCSDYAVTPMNIREVNAAWEKFLEEHPEAETLGHGHDYHGKSRRKGNFMVHPKKNS